MKKSRLKTNLIYQFIYRLLTVISPIITSPYLSRTLGPQKLGIYSATYAYANYYILFAMLGIELYGNRTISTVANNVVERRKLFWNIYCIQFVSSLLSLYIYYSTFGTVFGAERKLICTIQGVWIIASGLDINWYFFGKEQFKLTISRNIIVKFVSIICIFTFVRNENDLHKYVFIMAFSAFVSQVLLWAFLLKDIGFCKPQLKYAAKNIKPIFILFIPVVATSIFHIMDKSMVDLLSDERNGGFYYSVDRLINIPLGVITGLDTVMLPKISKLLHKKDYKQSENLLKKSSELSLFLVSAIAFGLGSVAKSLVPIFFGEEYAPCIIMIELFIPIILIKSISDFIRQQYLIPSKKDRLYLIAIISGAIVNVISNYFLIIHYGALGAVIGTFVAETVVLIVQIFGTYKEINFIKMFCKNGCYLIFGGLMYISVKLTETLMAFSGIPLLFILILTGGTVYIVLCVFYWIFYKKSLFNNYIRKYIHVFKDS